MSSEEKSRVPSIIPPNVSERLKVIRRPLLVAGMYGTTPDAIHIYVSDSLSKHETAVTLWHELIHVLQHSGAPIPTNDTELEKMEKEVENRAQVLGFLFPEIIDWMLPGVTFDNKTD